jgi:hypothetical protein
MSDDFAIVQDILNGSLDFVEHLKELNINALSEEAQLYLISQLKKHVGVLGGIVITYEQRKTQTIREK